MQDDAQDAHKDTKMQAIYNIIYIYIPTIKRNTKTHT